MIGKIIDLSVKIIILIVEECVHFLSISNLFCSIAVQSLWFLPMFFSFIFFWSFSWNIFAKQQPAQRRKLFLCSDKAEIFDDQPLNSWHSKIVWEYVSVFTQINTCSSHCQIKEICLRILTAPGFKKGKHCRQSGENEAHDFGDGEGLVVWYLFHHTVCCFCCFPDIELYFTFTHTHAHKNMINIKIYPFVPL